jgi:hypothetical protein
LRSKLQRSRAEQSKVLLEPRSVAHLTPVHRTQIQTHLRLTGLELGLLLTFSVPLKTDGIPCRVNSLEDRLLRSRELIA